ncbi:S-adenosyl-L-methionine-dependent methyltransferase [Lentinula raphanica]|nr:S-adenosyl-L-methionine-dependent methyltransferase [Lentinula raphanica]
MSGPSEVQRLLAIINQAATDALSEYATHGEDVPSIYEAKTHPLDLSDAAFNLKKIIRTLEGACHQLCATLAPPLHTVLNNGQDYSWACLRVAASKGITEILDDHPDGVHIDELSQKVGITKGKLATIMRTLVARHCYQEVSKDVYANNRLSLTLRSQTPGTAFLDLQTQEGQQAAFYLQKSLDDPVYGPATDLQHTAFTYSVKDTGFSGTLYEWIREHKDRLQVMIKGMVGMNQLMGTLSVLEVFPWGKYKTICDVGSGSGSFTWSLVQKFPAIEVTMFDLPETISVAEKAAADQKDGVDRVKFSSGNFFEGSPPDGLDVYYLRNIIHNWPDNSALSILQSVQKAMRKDSRVLVHDYILPSYHDPEGDNPAHALDKAPPPMLPDFGYGNMRLHNQNLTMLFMYNSRERTVAELTGLSQAAGLKLSRVWDLGETAVFELVRSDSSE